MSPARGPDSPETPENPDPPTSLTHRWWWQGAVLVVVGAVVISFQWEVIPSGAANPTNWLVAILGAAAAAYGVVELVRAHRRRRTDDGTPPQDSMP